MTDPLAAPGTEGAPAAPPPALTAQEIEALIERKSQELADRRISGLQSMYDGKIARLQSELAKVQKATFSETEIADARQSEVEVELAKARREAEMYRKGREYPDAFPVYERLMSAESVEEQLAALSEVLKARSVPPAAPAASAAPEPPTPPVDPNNPRRQSAPTEDFDGVPMNTDIARQILGSLREWPEF